MHQTEQKTVTFGARVIGDGHPCFITYEAGPTHDGLDSAKKLVHLAAEAGADAVKFQIIDPDRLVADKKQLFTYDILVDRETGKTETVSEPLYDILARRALSKDEWRDLKKYSDSLGLAFFATIGFEDEIRLLEELKCDSIKIASADVNHIPLIRMAAKTGMCLQLDTGNSSLGEIETAIDVIRREGNENIIIHQCPTGYPARLDSVNLRIILTLKQMFGYPTAYSDHVPGWEMDIAAISIGANLVEKTITLDRTTPSVEHIMSLEPSEMASFVKIIRDVETAMGAPRRILQPAEREKRMAIRRSIFLAEGAKKGQRLRDVKVEFRRPGFGIGPEMYDGLMDAVFTADLPSSHRLTWQDFSQPADKACAA
ncbi:MAG: N-acetylneuraminate synthase family protein [Alphaproteobacteria bacterium]|nr:N-acetylneuraminate synthase family protein [Alphaproteobacteria bacterium]